MEFVNGQTLESHLKERDSLPVARALQITEAVTQALREALDQIGLIHRDVKPANILITNSGHVKLADLGLAKVIAQEDATAHTAAGTAMGTPSYMSPEQFADASRVDHRADIFSLGATLYQMLAGKPPFRGDSFFQVLKQVEEVEPEPLPTHVPDAVGELVSRMMAKRADDRFQTHAELLDAIRAAQRSLGDTEEHVHQDIGAAYSPTMQTVIPKLKAVGQLVRPAVPSENRVLLVVDIQNDFCPNGALAVPGGDEVVPIINKLSRRFAHVILTQDWHCEDHLSFASSHPGKKPLERVELPYGEQILWPDHCVERTPGAEFHPKLDVAHCELTIRKGFHRDIDSYSAFFENDRHTPTGLAGYLRERGLTRLWPAKPPAPTPTHQPDSLRHQFQIHIVGAILDHHLQRRRRVRGVLLGQQILRGCAVVGLGSFHHRDDIFANGSAVELAVGRDLETAQLVGAAITDGGVLLCFLVEGVKHDHCSRDRFAIELQRSRDRMRRLLLDHHALLFAVRHLQVRRQNAFQQDVRDHGRVLLHGHPRNVIELAVVRSTHPTATTSG
ncbi:MAG: isochorismatase family protein [Planctomycetes bacterium]|nr:isochorismatase family protein [Planctomycetota bacterium]